MLHWAALSLLGGGGVPQAKWLGEAREATHLHSVLQGSGHRVGMGRRTLQRWGTLLGNEGPRAKA